MIIDLNEYRRYLEQITEIKKLNMTASYAALDYCLRMLNINDLPELCTIKRQIKEAMEKLEKYDG